MQAHPIGRLKVLANSRKQTAAATSPVSPETAEPFPEEQMGLPDASIDDKRGPTARFGAQESQKRSCNGGDEQLDAEASQLPPMPPLGLPMTSTPGKDQLLHDRPGRPAHSRAQLQHGMQVHPAIDRSLLLEQSNVLQVVAMPPVKAPWTQGKRSFRSTRQRSPLGGLKAVEELARIQELPQNDTAQFQGRDSDPQVNETTALARIPAGQDNMRSPTQFQMHKVASNAGPKQRILMDEPSGPQQSSPANFSLLLEARKSTLLGEKQTSAKVPADAGSRARVDLHGPSNTERRSRRPNDADSQLRIHSSNRQNFSSDSASQGRRIALNASPKTHFNKSYLDRNREPSEQLALALSLPGPNEPPKEQRRGKEDEYGLKTSWRPVIATQSSIELGGDGTGQHKDLNLDQRKHGGPAAKSPPGFRDPRIPDAGLSDQGPRTGGLSTRRRSASKREDESQPMNGDIIDSMGQAGRKRHRTSPLKFKFNLRPGQGPESHREEDETARRGATGRGSTGREQVPAVQFGVVGKSAFSIAKVTGRDSGADMQNDGQPIARAGVKHNDLEKNASTSRSVIRAPPHQASNTQHDRGQHSPFGSTSQWNKYPPDQAPLPLRETPDAFLQPHGESQRGHGPSSPSARDSSMEKSPAALANKARQLSLDGQMAGDASRRAEPGDEGFHHGQVAKLAYDRGGHGTHSLPDQGKELLAGDAACGQDAPSAARMAADIQQYILQESQTVYNNLKSFNGKRRFNQGIMSKLKMQAELSRAKRHQGPGDDTFRLLHIRKGMPGDSGPASPPSSQRETMKRIQRLPPQQYSDQEQKIVVLGMRRDSEAAEDSRRSTALASSSGKVQKRRHALEKASAPGRAAHELIMASLQDQTDRGALFNEEYASLQHRNATGRAVQAATNRTLPGFDITKLSAGQGPVDRQGARARDSATSKQQSITTMNAPSTQRQKPHVVEIGSFSLMPDAKLFGGQSQKNGTEYIPRDTGAAEQLPLTYDLMSPRESNEQSPGKVHETPSHWTPLVQPRLERASADKNEQGITQRRAPDPANQQSTARHGSGTERQALDGTLLAATRKSTLYQSVNEDLRHPVIDAKGSDVGGHDTTEGLLLGTSRDQVPSEYLPEAASQRIHRVLETPFQEKVIDEKDEYQVDSATVEPSRRDTKIAAPPGLEALPSEILSRTMANRGLQATHGHSGARTKTMQANDSSSPRDPRKIDETEQKNIKGSNSGGIEASPSSKAINSFYLQNQPSAPSQRPYEKTLNGEIGAIEMIESPLKPSLEPAGPGRKVSSPATEHAYLKIDSVLSHGDGKTYTKKESGPRASGTTYSSPRGLDGSTTIQQNAILAGQPLRLGSKPELQNQVVYQVVGSRSQQKRNEMRISERGSSRQKGGLPSRPDSAGGSETSNLAVARLRQRSIAEGEDRARGPRQEGMVAENDQPNGVEQDQHHIDSLVGSSTRFPLTLTDRTDAKIPAEASSYLEQQHDSQQIQAAIKQLQGIIKQKKRQFRVRNSLSVLEKPMNTARLRPIPESWSQIMPPKYPVDMNQRRSRLMDYFPKQTEDAQAVAPTLEGSSMRRPHPQAGPADRLEVDLNSRRNCQSQQAADANVGSLNIRIENMEANWQDGQARQLARGSSEDHEAPSAQQSQVDNGRLNFNSNTGWRRRSQNFSMTNVFHIKKRIQIENMVSYNFPKLLQLSHRALDYGNLYRLPSLVDRKRLVADTKRGSERSRLLSQHQSRRTQRSPTSECAMDDMIQAVNPKKLITNIAPNTCSTVTKWKMYQQISRAAEEAKDLRSEQPANDGSNLAGSEPERPLKNGAHEQTAEAAGGGTEASQPAERPGKEHDEGAVSKVQPPDDEQMPLKLTDRLFPLRKGSLERSLAGSRQDYQLTQYASSQPPKSHLGPRERRRQPCPKRATGRLDSQGLPRERTDALLPVANLPGLSNGPPARHASSELQSRFSMSAAGSAAPSGKVEHRRLAVPYALPEASYQQFERNHKHFLDQSRQRRITQEQKIRYLLKHI